MKITKRNPIADALRLFKPKRVKSKKVYSRKGKKKCEICL